MSDYRREDRGGLPSLIGLGVLGCLLLTAPAPVAGQSVLGQGTAASVRTPTTGSQTFASATLPSGGGMNNADVDAASLANALGASDLTSITTGQIDETLVSATTSAQATGVTILNGLITAKAVLALATSYANGTAAVSESNGSTLLGLVVNGVWYGDGAPAPNTRLDLPGVGYVVLNEQISSGDGVHDTGLTVNMIHVYLTDPVTGASIGDIVLGGAQSGASL
ncbi:MAG TPA: choice-of-anchor P family protein [Gemmatimonadales bacterium]|nr:choice-of-anchor P family protein [Gemmatimonadales bacterium]